MIPAEWATVSKGLTGKTIAEVLVEKHPAEKNPIGLHWKSTRKHLFYYHGYYGGCSQFGNMETFGDIRAWWYGLSSFTGVATKVQGTQKKIVLVLNIYWNGWPIRTHHGPPTGNLFLST